MTSARVFSPRVGIRVSTLLLLAAPLCAGGLLAQRPAPRTEQFKQAQPLAFEASGKVASTFEAGQPQPLAMASADFDEDGVADLVVGYGLDKGGVIALLRGNLDALAPQSYQSWLAAGQGHFASPFLAQAGLTSLPVAPDLLIVADVNGDGHRDLVVAARNGNTLYVLLGDGKGNFVLQPPVAVAGAITALAAYRPGDNRTSDVVIAGVTGNSGSHATLFRSGVSGLSQQATYALPGKATAIEIANLDADFIPDAAIVAGGQLVVLHGAHALAGSAQLESLPIDDITAVTAGDFLFDRHAQLQLSVLTSDGTVHVLAHTGFDPTSYTHAELVAARRESTRPGALTLAQKAGNTGGQPWIEIENYPGIASSSPESSAPILLHSGVSGNGGQDIMVFDSSAQQIATIHHPASPSGATASSASSPGQAIVRHGTFGSNAVVAALSQRVSPQGSDGIVLLPRGSIHPEIATPASGNVLYVNTTTDSSDINDTNRCTSGSAEVCSLRDAVGDANADAADNIPDATVDTIMVPAGTYNLTLNEGQTDGNGNGETLLDITGPVTIMGVAGSTTINAGQNDKVFSIDPNLDSAFNTTLENLTLENGENANNPASNANADNFGGALDWEAYGTGNLTITNCTLTGNMALWGPGGAIFESNSLGGSGLLTVTNSTFTSNQTPEVGGAINVGYGAATAITNTVFSSNTAAVSVNTSDTGQVGQGGALFLYQRGSSATPQSTIGGGSIGSNTSSSDGGGVYTNTGIDFTGGTAFSANSSSGAGGAIFHNTANNGFAETTTITAANFTTNSAVTTGGAITVGTGTAAQGNLLTIADSRIFSNTSASGASGLSVGEPATSGAGGVTATENWWGCNTGPQVAADGCDQATLYFNGAGNLSTDPNIVLTLTPIPNIVQVDSSLQLAASVSADSNGNPVPGGPGPLQGLSVGFTVAVGAFNGSSSDAIDASGNASITVTPTSVGFGTATAQLDNQTTTAPFTVNPGPATYFSVAATSPVVSFQNNPLTVTAFDQYGNVATGYTGIVTFTSTDPGYVNSSGNGPLTNGVGIFNFALKTAGIQTITATDSVNATITGTSNPIIVLPGPATRFFVSAPSQAIVGSAFNFTVTAEDLYGNLATSYAGTVAFSSTDAGATLPANSTLINGAGTFSATLATPGSQSITATDTVTASITGMSGPISVTSPNLVVTSVLDDAGTASNCTIQTTPGTGTDPSCSLRDALLEAASLGSGNITFDATKFSAATTITLLGSGTLNIPSFTTVTGPTTGSGASLTNLVTVSGNNSYTVFTEAGGVTAASLSNLIISDGNVANNGGGINNAGTLTVNNSTISGNSACNGGGIYNAGALTINNSTLSGNYGAGYITGCGNGGGGIDNASGTLIVNDSTFSGNNSAPGGAILADNGTLTLTNSTFAGNSALNGRAGGAIFINNALVTVSNSVFTGNSAASGGAIFNYETLAVTSSILSGDTGGECGSLGASTCPVNGVNQNVVGSSSVVLAALGYYGGPTQTMIPLPGSPAICFITPSAATGNDQRGLPRVTPYSGTNCQDAGAVQTNYSIAFVQQPSNVTANASMSPAPTVELLESNAAFADGTDTVTIPLSLTTGAGTVSGGSVATSATTGIATYSALSINTPGTGDVLTATLALNPATAPLTTLTVPGSSFNVNPPPPVVIADAISAVATIAFNGHVATFDDRLTNLEPLSDFTASVDWGDGTSSAGNITQPGGAGSLYVVSATHTYLVRGSYTFTVTVNNTLGSSNSAFGTATATVASAPATHFMIVSPSSSLAGSAFSITVSALDAGNNVSTSYTGTVHFTSSDAAAVLPANYTFTAGDNGVHAFNVTLKTPGNQTITATDTTTAITGTSPTIAVHQAPAITSAAATTFQVGSAGSFTVTTTGFSTPALSETGALPVGVIFIDNGDGTATLSGAPAAGSGGTYPITIKASNGTLPNAQQNFTLTVAQTPAITSAAATSFQVGSAGVFTVTASGFPTPALSETGTLPGGVTFTDNGNGTATLSGMPAAGAGGTYSITIKASNGTLPNAQQNFTLTVDQAPAITSANSATVITGAHESMIIVSSGFPVAALSESGALPSGVTFTDNGDGTATLAGTPAAGTANIYSLAITASNGVVPNAIQVFTLTVNPPPSFVVTTASDDATGTPGNCPGSNCSLRDTLAAAAAASGGIITFDPADFPSATTITLTSGNTLNIPSNTTITGLTSGSGATLKNLVTVSGPAPTTGNALFTANGTGSTISQLNVVAQGGAALTYAITMNYATGLTIEGSNITAVPAAGVTAPIGGVFNDYNSTITLIDSTLSGFTTYGFTNEAGATITLMASTVSGNQAIGVENGPGTLIVNSSTISGNTNANSGGGIYNSGGTVTITSSTISGNTAGAQGGGLASTGGTVTISNSIVAGNSASSYADIFGSYTDGGGNLAGTGSGGTSTITPNLAALGNYGGTTQTLIPLPGSRAICFISPSAATGSDQRGDPRTTTYGATTCQDSGAVETNYSLNFTVQPSSVAQFAFMAPPPAVTLYESGTAFADGTDSIIIPLTLTTIGPGTLTGGSAATSPTTGIATYSALSINGLGSGDLLTATLSLNPASIPPTSISAPSNPFNVIPPVAQLLFSTPPASSVTAGGNAGAAITVDEDNPSSVIVTEATDAITLTVTGPKGYAKTYTVTAVNGVATFNLSSAALTAVGGYSYSAAITQKPAVTVATASETVTAAAPASVSVVSGTPQSAIIGAAFTRPLKVLVTDQFSNPVSGASVAFSSPASGASAVLAGSPATTAADGTASVTATANGTASGTAYTVSASVTGAGAAASFLLTNLQHSTSISLTTAPAVPVYGQPLTVTAAIAPSSVAGSSPTGTVTFSDHLNPLTPSPVVNAAATLTLNTPPAGSHSFTATYSGDSNFLTSTTTSASAVTVGKASSTLSGPAPLNLTYGTAGSIAISIAGQYSGAGIATPSGSISYSLGNGVNGTAPISSGSATIPVPATLAAGAYTVTVNYSGDGNYAAANQITVDLSVAQAATTTTLTASSGSVTPLQSVKLTAQVASATTGTPTGTVSFYDGTTLLATVTLSGGTASYSTTLAPGVTHSLSATYNGSIDFLSSTSTASVGVVVAPLDFTMTLVGPSSQTVVPGSTITYQAKVTPDYGAYAGTVNFAISGLPPGATVTFSPATIDANGGPQTVTVTIQTAPATANNQAPSPPATGRRVTPFALALLLLFGVGGMRRNGRHLKRLLSLLILLAAGAAATAFSGCGGNGFFTQAPQNYTITITATAGSLEHSATVTLNVQ